MWDQSFWRTAAGDEQNIWHNPGLHIHPCWCSHILREAKSIPEVTASLSQLSGSKKSLSKVGRWRATSIPRRIGVGFWPLVRHVSLAWDLRGMHPGGGGNSYEFTFPLTFPNLCHFSVTVAHKIAFIQQWEKINPISPCIW